VFFQEFFFWPPLKKGTIQTEQGIKNTAKGVCKTRRTKKFLYSREKVGFTPSAFKPKPARLDLIHYLVN
jgi:hypothetical protein